MTDVAGIAMELLFGEIREFHGQCSRLASSGRPVMRQSVPQSCPQGAGPPGSWPCAGQLSVRSGAHQVNAIVIASEGVRAFGDIVGDDPVAVLGAELASGPFDDIAGFRRESDHEVRAPVSRRGERGQDVRILDKFDARRRDSVLLPLFRSGVGDPPVGDRSGTHRDIGRQGVQAGAHHVARRLDAHDLGTGGILERHRPGNKGHPRSKIETGRSHGVSLLAGTAVADIAHGIDRFTRRAARDENVAPAERTVFAPVKEPFDGACNRFRLAHAAGADLAAGKIARLRSDHGNAVGQKPGDIAAHRRMAPHPGVHGRSREHRLVGRKQHRRREVVGDAGGHAGKQVRARRRDHHEIRFPGQTDMAHLGFVGEREEIGVDPFAGKRRNGKRRHELGCGRCHDAPHAGAPVTQPPDQIERLVGRYAARDDEQNAPVTEHRRGPVGWRHHTPVHAPE